MFHNPFNNKVVADIGKFLNEHRDDINIDPCLDGHAKEAAKSVAAQPILEERRNILTKAFNEAVKDCGCRGSNKESIDFGKAVDKYVRTNPPSTESVEEAVTDYKVVGTATYMRKDKGRWSPVNFDIQFKEVGGTTYYRKDRGPWLPMKKGDKYLGKNP
jgi:hypothetical protein